MPVECAACESFVCRGGNRDAGPELCPMKGPFPTFARLYLDGASRCLLLNASLVEARGYGRWTRLRETAELARLLKAPLVGIAHGPDMVVQARKVATFLRKSGLDPILPPGAGCNDPLGQVGHFERKGTELNVIAGMGVAEECLFLKESVTPTVSLLARDARLRHNPAAALYTSRGYSMDELHGHWPQAERPHSFRGLAGILERATGPEMPTPCSRVAEAMDLAHGIGASYLGISFCVGLREEAKLLARIFEINGFRVASVCCKTGAVPKEEAGIRDEEKVRPGRPEMICNPVAQAELLNREGVDLAFVLGQCVGHDAATFRHLNPPAACLVAKDRVLGHNPVAAL